jgi:AcrR family transcriptional regulator
MDATRMDARVERSRAQLIAALADLARERPVAQVSVSALCTAAGVSRPTFYQHFSSVGEVMTAALDDRLAEVAAAAGSETDQDVPATIIRFLGELDRDRQTYRVLLGDEVLMTGAGEALRMWLARRLADRFGLGPDADMALVYASAGMVAVISAWLRNPVEDGEHALAERIWSLTTSVLGPVEPR